MSDAEQTTTSESWWYPLKYGDTLSNHDWVPLYLNRLLTSRFVAYAVADGRRADIGTALILWTESFKQDPAGTLPDDDVELAQIARFGSDVGAWRAARAGALYGWMPTEIENSETGSSARLGHLTIADIAWDMHKRKRGRDGAREAGRMAQLRSRVRKKLTGMRVAKHIVESQQVIGEVASYLDQAGLYCTDDNVKIALSERIGLTADVTPIGRGGAVS